MESNLNNVILNTMNSVDLNIKIDLKKLLS